MITFLSQEDITRMMEIFKAAGVDAITWSHYELASKTDIDDPEMWKAFLMDPAVSQWLQSELNIIKDSELKKMVKGAATTRSVGQAQLINAFSKLNENTAVKDGPVFIYTHVPLNNQQEHAPNVQRLTNNPFVGGSE